MQHGQPPNPQLQPLGCTLILTYMLTCRALAPSSTCKPTPNLQNPHTCKSNPHLQEDVLPFHIVSDHLMLAGTILVCLHVELVCVLSDMLRTLSSPAVAAARQVAMSAVLLGTAALYLCTAADMYYTAKHFHTPGETLMTVFVVFLLIQLPVLRWVDVKRQKGITALQA